MIKETTGQKKYQNIQIIGNGTFGVVYLVQFGLCWKAKDLTTNQKVAIKHVHQNDKYKNRELEIMKSINH